MADIGLALLTVEQFEKIPLDPRLPIVHHLLPANRWIRHQRKEKGSLVPIPKSPVNPMDVMKKLLTLDIHLFVPFVKW
jgi:hypothetical protein